MLVTTNIVGNNSRVFPFLCPLCCTFFCWEGLSQRVGTVTRRWWYTSSTHHLVFLHKISIKSSLSCNFGYRWLDHYPFTGMCYILFFHLRSRSILNFFRPYREIVKHSKLQHRPLPHNKPRTPLYREIRILNINLDVHCCRTLTNNY